MNIQNFKTTKTTAIVTFRTEDAKDLKKVKALTIIYGYFNPLKQEIKNSQLVLETIDSYKNTGLPSLEDAIKIISNELI